MVPFCRAAIDMLTHLQVLYATSLYAYTMATLAHWRWRYEPSEVCLWELPILLAVLQPRRRWLFSLISDVSVADGAVFKSILPSAIILLVLLPRPTTHKQYHDLTQFDAGGDALTNNTRNAISCVYWRTHHIVIVLYLIKSFSYSQLSYLQKIQKDDDTEDYNYNYDEAESEDSEDEDDRLMPSCFM